MCHSVKNFHNTFRNAEYIELDNMNLIYFFQNRSDFIQLMTEAQQGKEIYDKKDEKEVETLSTNTSVVGKFT